VLVLLLLLAIPATAEIVEIIRDGYGTPHIFAETPAGAAFGAGYAQAEDRPKALLQNLSLDEEPIALSAELRVLVDSYVAGANRALGQTQVTAGQVVAFSRRAYTWIHGANDLFLPPSRTASKSVIAILDPIADWDAPDRPYEMSLYAGGLAVAGVAPVGMPFPVVGHSLHVAIGWSGDSGLAGPRALEEAWALLTARSMEDVRRAVSMGQIPGRLSCGTSAGEVCSEEGRPVVQEKLRVQQTWSFANVEALAFNTEVDKADVWQRLLSRVAPNDRFARVLTSWNRRADANSRGALAFYLFKMELARDASQSAPSDSLSPARILSALTRARDRLETQLDFNATWGSEFRITRDGSRVSYAASGGNLPEAGITTPRTLIFAGNRSHAGQAAPRIVELSSTPSATSILLPGVSDDPASPHFEDQAGLMKPKQTYFGNRRELERAASSRKQLMF
jgi:acyl-homoserine lactone acylase PvdQ